MTPSESPLDDVIESLRSILQPVQDRLDIEPRTTWPVPAIVGCPRSGTTLLLQVLANAGCFAFPTNLLARFAYAPYVGSLIQRMLFDPRYDRHGEFADLRSRPEFRSVLGKTEGALAANEFQHFFRMQIPHLYPKRLSDEELNCVDFDWIAKGLASIESVFEMPFVTKAGMLQGNLADFDRRISRFLWVRVTRDASDTMRSIFAARKVYHGDRSKWWSVQPKEHAWLAPMDVFHQIAGQVFFTEQALSRELESVPVERQFRVDYADICRHPKDVLNQLIAALGNLGCRVTSEYTGPQSFVPPARHPLSVADAAAFDAAYVDFAEKRAGFEPPC